MLTFVVQMCIIKYFNFMRCEGARRWRVSYAFALLIVLRAVEARGWHRRKAEVRRVGRWKGEGATWKTQNCAFFLQLISLWLFTLSCSTFVSTFHSLFVRGSLASAAFLAGNLFPLHLPPILDELNLHFECRHCELDFHGWNEMEEGNIERLELCARNRWECFDTMRFEIFVRALSLGFEGDWNEAFWSELLLGFWKARKMFLFKRIF